MFDKLFTLYITPRGSRESDRSGSSHLWSVSRRGHQPDSSGIMIHPSGSNEYQVKVSPPSRNGRGLQVWNGMKMMSLEDMHGLRVDTEVRVVTR